MNDQAVTPSSHIIIKGAKQHNLKNIDLNIPKNQLVVFTGLSGSGKSSLAFDTIYAEGQRKYVESLSSYARQFLGIMQKPDVDQIEGLSPAISIDQKTTSHNPRSTVGTITEIYDYLRLLYARIGHPRCPTCNIEISPQDIDQITTHIYQQIESSISGSFPGRFVILSPLVKDKRGEFSQLFNNLQKKGFSHIRLDGHTMPLNEDIVLIKTNRHTIEAVIERISISSKELKNEAQIQSFKSRLNQAIEKALELSDGQVICSHILDASLEFPTNPTNFQDTLYNQHLACPQCHRSFPELEPRLFSFNTPEGACPACDGLGSILKINVDKLVAPELTLSEGAIIPLASAMSTDSWYARKMTAILHDNDIPTNTPYQDLPEAIKKIILYGQKKSYRVSGENRQGRVASFTFEPEGIVNELERRYSETQSDYMRSEIGRYMQKETCQTCQGDRLKPMSLAVTILSQNIADTVNLPIKNSLTWINTLQAQIDNPLLLDLSPSEKIIATSIVREIKSRLEFLDSVGLSYLSLSREASTLAGGEAQRIRLASQIGTGLTGVLYVLDEPTIGLHSRDNERLIKTLIKLKELGNTLIVVEHDEHVIKSADHIIDFGPRAGEHGGQVVAQGNFNDIIQTKNSLTGQYLKGNKTISAKDIKAKARTLNLDVTSHQSVVEGEITLKNAHAHNLKHIDVTIPLSKFVVITGVSGSGKSTLLHDTLYPALRQALELTVDQPIKYDSLIGTSQISKVYLIDQSPIGRTPRSNPATYTKMFDLIRIVFAQTKDAQSRGFKPGRFSFNVKGGRCEACQGGGQVKIAMQFLSDIYVTCDVCRGKRYNQETLSIKYKGLSIADVLDLTIDQALDVFASHSHIQKKLLTLKAVGLGYIRLGQAAPTLSGGEAQRVKLAKELSINSPGHTIYLLDEPTTGLHFEDVNNLLVVLNKLVSNNNTVITIEHNLDVIKTADWIIDLGPDGGADGGRIIAEGNVDDITTSPESYTGKYLKTNT
jgi:excinuclease ABC subunit A